MHGLRDVLPELSRGPYRHEQEKEESPGALPGRVLALRGLPDGLPRRSDQNRLPYGDDVTGISQSGDVPPGCLYPCLYRALPTLTNPGVHVLMEADFEDQSDGAYGAIF